MAQVHWVRVEEDGRPDMGHLEELLKAHKNEPVLVSLMHANNELGTRIDLDEVGRLCRAHGALFHSDTVQTMGHYRFDLSRTPIDFLSASAHKFHGPKGVGFLYMRSGAVLKPMMLGGSQERNMRAGTENITGIVGMARALEIATREVEEHEHHVRGLKELLKRRIVEEIPGAGSTATPDPTASTPCSACASPMTGRARC
jgi:cysteine desulfurase